jgi:transcription elongation factor Elf1
MNSNRVQEVAEQSFIYPPRATEGHIRCMGCGRVDEFVGTIGEGGTSFLVTCTFCGVTLAFEERPILEVPE